MTLLIGFLAVSVATAAWTDSPRYGPDYVGGSQMPGMGSRSSNCIPCEERRIDGSNSNTLDFRGNGADNLGYDWSPKAWGGPAFPKSGERNQPNSDWGGRDGRRMPGPWDDKCRDCSPPWPGSGMRWDRFTERPDNRGTHPPWSSSTERTADVSTVTSSVLGIRLQDDKRLPVEWGGRSMRWDGFRNGMPWERPAEPDHMDRRDGSDYRPWEAPNKGGWDQDSKGHYASDWSYGSRDPAGSGTRWNGQRPWTQSWDQRKPTNDYDQSGGSPPFGSSYPSTDRFPSNSYGSSSFPTSTWRPSTSSYPTNKPYYNYPTSGRPGGQPEIIKVRPGYGVIDQPERPNPNGGAPWNYSPDGFNTRPSQWPSRPSDNYLPQNNRPKPSANDYGRPTEGVPGTAIWNGRPGPDEYRPGQGSKPPNGFYQGFITEIHDPNYAQGNKYPNNRPGYPNDRPPSTTDDRYGSQNPSHNRFPDRYDRPGQGNSLYPTSRPDSSWNRNPGYDTNRDRYPNPGYGNNRPGLDADRNRYPSKDNDRNQYGNDRDRDRYPSKDYDRNQYGSDRDRYPHSDYDRNQHGSDRDRYPNYDRDRNPSYNGNSRPQYSDSDRYPNRDRDRYPSDSNRQPGHESDRYPSDSNRQPGYESDRYPSRPSSDHDRGPNPGTDQGSWNYGEDSNKDGTYRRSGGSYPSYKGGQYYTSGYLASASTPAASSHEADKKNNDQTTVASTSQEK